VNSVLSLGPEGRGPWFNLLGGETFLSPYKPFQIATLNKGGLPIEFQLYGAGGPPIEYQLYGAGGLPIEYQLYGAGGLPI